SNFTDQPAQYINQIDGQHSHDQRNKKMFSFAEHVKGSNDDSKRESNGDESAQVTHAISTWIDNSVHLVELQFSSGTAFSDNNRHPLTPICTFYGSEHHRQALDIVGTARLCRYSLRNVPQKLRHHAKVSAGLIGIGLFGRTKTLGFVEEAFRFLDIFTSNVVKSVPADRAFGADNPPDAIPRSAQTFGAPHSTEGAPNVAAHLKARMRRAGA